MMWNYVKLEELYTVHNGLSKGRKYFGTGHPFLSFSTVFNNYFIPEELNDLVQTTEKEQENYSIKRGDIFVTRTSETSDELGMSCVALKDYPKATYNGFTKRMRPIDENVILPEFIGYYMRLPSFRSEFQAFSTMTTRASLRNEDLLSLKVPVPPMEVQIKIANTLSNYDNLIQNNKKQIKLLEEASQRLYKEWFVDLRFPGYEELEIIDGCPKNWSKKSILDNEIFKFAKSRVIPFDGEKHYYATADVVGTTLITEGIMITFDNKPSRASVQPLENSVWFARMSNSYKILNCFGTSAHLANDSVISSGFAGFTSLEGCYGFVYQTIASDKFDEEKNRYATGATQVSLTNEGLKRIEVLIPTIDIVKQYSKIVEPFMKKAELLKQNCVLLQQSRDRLLPKLMSGEIEV